MIGPVLPPFPRVKLAILRSVGRLRRDERGNALTEFAIVAPVFLTLLLGTFDIGQMVYAKSVLNGAVEQAARKSSLEGGDTDAADKMVERMVRPILPGVVVESERKSYFDFVDVGRAEIFTDANHNETCDNGESYTEEVNIGQWDEDIGQDGNGGANDVVIYTVTATYAPTFKIPFAPASWNERKLTSTAVRKNQPFAAQQAYGTGGGTCTDPE